MATLELDARPVLRIGRARAQHLPRVLIDGEGHNARVVVRTRCGLDSPPEGFGETYGFVTCDDCIAAEVE